MSVSFLSFECPLADVALSVGVTWMEFHLVSEPKTDQISLFSLSVSRYSKDKRRAYGDFGCNQYCE